MKKIISYVVIFVLGFAACAMIYNHQFVCKTSDSIESVSVPIHGPNIIGKNKDSVRAASSVVSEYVVNIDTVGTPIFERIPFGDIFGMRGQSFTQRGQASGVIFSESGYILTNNHVVEGTSKLYVTLANGEKYDAKLIGRDPQTDLAIIKIDAKKKLKYAKFGDSDKLEVGDWVIAVGNALGLGKTVTVGVVSAKREEFEINGKVFSALIQTDAAINQGNSGGALSDLNGNLVGINTAIVSTSQNGGNIGIGFAVPSKTVKNVANQIIKKGKVSRPYLGIRYIGITKQVRKELESRGFKGLPIDGALIMEIYNNSPASTSGLKPGDVIVKIGNKLVTGEEQSSKDKVTVSDAITKSKVGSSLNMEVWHHTTGRTGTVNVRIGEMPANM